MRRATRRRRWLDADREDRRSGGRGQAIAAAPTTAELEELRVRYLGRKAELTSILRGIAELPADERGPVGKAGQRGAEGAGGELERARGRARRRGARSAPRRGRDRRDAARRAAGAGGARHLLIRTLREIEDVFIGLGYRVMEGPEVELDYYNFTALNHPPGHPARMAQDTFYVDPSTLRGDLRIWSNGDALPPGPEDVVLRTHTSPMQVRSMEAQEPPIFIVVPGRCYRSDPFDATHSPIFHQVEGLAVGRGHHARRPEGNARRVRQGDLRRRARDALPARLLPLHRAERRGRRLLLPLRRHRRAAGRLARPALQGVGWIEILGAGMVDPNVFGFVASAATTPSGSRGSRSAWGSSGSRC